MSGAANQQIVMQNGATGTGNGAVAPTEGYGGALTLAIFNGAGTCTVTVEGSFDQAFTNTQEVLTLGVVRLSDTGAGTNVARSVVSGAISVGANTSYLYGIQDSVPFIRARISNAAGLGAGTNEPGCTVKLDMVAD